MITKILLDYWRNTTTSQIRHCCPLSPDSRDRDGCLSMISSAQYQDGAFISSTLLTSGLFNILSINTPILLFNLLRCLTFHISLLRLISCCQCVLICLCWRLISIKKNWDYVYGTYILHEMGIFERKMIWEKWLKNSGNHISIYVYICNRKKKIDDTSPLYMMVSYPSRIVVTRTNNGW